MSYTRVIPRDLFNEAKLLKCLGKICLDHHDNYKLLNKVTVTHENEASGFQIEQDENDGSIFISNLYFFDVNGTPLQFSTSLNSRENWPLILEYKNETYNVFTDNGNYSEEFKEFMWNLES